MLESFICNRDIEAGNMLVLAPHADDESIGCAGWIIKSQCSNVKRILVICSKLDEERKIELYAAMCNLKIDLIVSLGLEELVVSSKQQFSSSVNLLVSVFQKYDPHYIFLPNLDDVHPDHKQAHRLLIGALSNSKLDDFMPYIIQYEVFMPLTHVNWILDISSIIDEKISVIEKYVEQNKKYRLARIVRNLNAFRGLTLFRNKVEYGEAYLRLNKNQYIQCFRSRRF